MVEVIVFVVAAAIVLGAALGVVLLRNPVHNALSLVATLFGVAVLFVAQEANFLAAIQVIVYAGAIVVLFLFVIMLLGVDRIDTLGIDTIGGKGLAALIGGVLVAGLSLVGILAGASTVTGRHSSTEALAEGGGDINAIARVLFTDYIFAFEITAALLTIAVVAAVVLARKPTGDVVDFDPDAQATAADDADGADDREGAT